MSIWRTLLSVCWVMLPATAALAADGPAGHVCRKSPDFYKGYTVKQVRVETPLSINTPLGFLFGAQQQLQDEFESTKQQLPLKEGAAFDRVVHSRAIEMLGDKYREMALRPGERLRFSFVTYSLEQCDETARTIGVAYRIYSSDFLYYVSRIFETRPDKITRSLAPGRISERGAIANTNNKLLPQPFVGYNRSRGLFAGTKASFKSEGGIFERVDMDVSGSASSATAGLSLSGSEGFNTGWLSYLDWRVGYRYFNLPSDDLDLKAGTVLAQLFGATQPLGDSNVVFRFGGSVEGGNRQTDLEKNIDLSSTLAQSRYGAAKLYTGVTFNHGRQAWTASYGLQLGNNDAGFSVDYLKHIVDTGYDARFLWREHRPLRLEVGFTAGAIQSSSGRVPIVERFFGGNVRRRFVEGDDWVINSSPLIRSFPENRLNRVGPDSPVGGKNFFSFNVTVTQPVWNRPAVPDEISGDSGISSAIGAGLQTARKATFDSYLVEEPRYNELYKSLAARLNELEAAVEPLPKKLEDLQSQDPPPPQSVLDKVEQIGDDPVLETDLLEDAQERIEQAKSSKDQFRSGIRSLVAGFSATRPGLMTRLVVDLTELREALRLAGLNSDAEQIDAAANRLQQLQSDMLPMFNQLLALGQVSIADLQPVRAALKDNTGGDDVERVLRRMGAIVGEIRLQSAGAKPVADLIGPLETQIEEAKSALAIATAAPDSSSLDDIQNGIDQLMVGFGELVPATTSKITTEIKRVKQPLNDSNLNAQAVELSREADKLAAFQKEVRRRLGTIKRADAERKAGRDIAFASRSLETVFRELNLIAISPTVMFDSARIGPQTGNNQGGVRYGLGAGVRFSLVTLDITLGYSWKLDRRPGEGRGAFVFSMNISDIFR